MLGGGGVRAVGESEDRLQGRRARDALLSLTLVARGEALGGGGVTLTALAGRDLEINVRNCS